MSPLESLRQASISFEPPFFVCAVRNKNALFHAQAYDTRDYLFSASRVSAEILECLSVNFG
jgi:hypothetical protein